MPKLFLILLGLVASSGSLNPGKDIITLPMLLEIFRTCSLTYYNLQDMEQRQPTLLQKLQNKFVEHNVTLQLFSFQTTSIRNGSLQAGSSVVSTGHFKFSSCTVLIFPFEHSEISTELTMANFTFSSLLSEFFWFLSASSSSPQSDKHVTKYHHIVKSHKPAIYLEIANLSQVSFICLPCMRWTIEEVNQKIVLNKKDIFGRNPTPSHIRKSWIQLHSNMQQIPFASFKFQDLTYQIPQYFHTDHTTPCSPYPGVTNYFDPRVCTIILLSRTYNYSLTIRNVDKEDIGFSRLHFIIVDKAYLDQNLINSRKEGISLPIFGVDLDLYGFMVLYDKKNLHVNELRLLGILAPFPAWVWLAIGFLSFLTSTLLWWNWETSQIIFGNLMHSWFTFTSLLLDQPSPKIPGGKDGLEKLKLWLPWSIFCLIISQGYRGFLFSSLAVVTTPVTPATVGELIGTGMLLGSTEVYYQPNGTRGPALCDKILPELTKLMKKKDMYLELQISVKWFGNSVVPISVNISKQKTVWVGAPPTPIRVPNKFAIIDPIYRLDFLRSLFEQLGVFWVSPSIVEFTVLARGVWYTTNNYVFPIFSEWLSHVYESGLLERWQAFFTEHHKKLRKREQMMLQGMYEKLQVLHRSHEISKEIYLDILLHYAAFIGASVLIFVSELLYCSHNFLCQRFSCTSSKQ